MTLPVAMMGAGAAVGGISSILSSVFQGQVARNNAQIAQQNEAYAASAGAANTEMEGLKARSQLANERVRQGALNVNVNSGSAADTQVSQRELGALDQATVANNAALQAYGYRTQWANYENQAHVDDISAVMGGLTGAVGVGNALSSLSGGGGAPNAGLGADNQGGADLVDPSILSGTSDLDEQYQWMQETGAYGVGG